MAKLDKYVFVCTNERPADHPKGSCTGRRSSDVLQRFRDVESERPESGFRVVATQCLGPCLSGPTVAVYPDDIWYGGVTVGDVERIVDEHLSQGRPIAALMLSDEQFERPKGLGKSGP